MEVGVCGGGYVEEEARLGQNVWGGRGPVIFAIKWSIKNRKIKLHLGLRRPLFET